MPSIPSICIPRVYSNITRREVQTTFETILGEGCVERIDMILKRDGMQPYQCVFIHFHQNYKHTTEQSARIADRLCKGLNVKIVYNDPWFWKCSLMFQGNPQKLSMHHQKYM